MFFEKQILIGTLMIIGTVIFHVSALVYLANLLDRLSKSIKVITSFQAIFLVSIAVLVVVLIHTAEALAWAELFRQIGEFTDLKPALYFSIVTSTTLGYGDFTLSERWQLLSTFEAMGGLILFGVTTAFLLEILRPILAQPSSPDEINRQKGIS